MKNIDEVRVERDGTLLATFYVVIMLWLNSITRYTIFLCSNLRTKALLMGPPWRK